MFSPTLLTAFQHTAFVILTLYKRVTAAAGDAIRAVYLVGGGWKYQAVLESVRQWMFQAEINSSLLWSGHPVIRDNFLIKAPGNLMRLLKEC